MYNYIVKTDDGARIYYYKPVLGICEVSGNLENIILKDATDKFFVYRDKDAIKAVVLNNKAQLLYMTYKKGEWKSYVIATIKKDIKIEKIMVGTNGNNAMPSVIAKLYDKEFFLFGKSVYYSNENLIIGYQSFADSKPDRFIPCYEGECTYVIDKKIVYKKDNDIFINEKKICSDKNIKMPVLVKDLLMWKAGSYIRYIPLSTGKIRQFVSSGVEPEIFVLAAANECFYYYGTFSHGKLKLFT